MAKRLRRSWLLVLTADEAKVGKAAKTNADVLILDLSDFVTPDKKIMARKRVVEWLTSAHPFGDKQIVVKPNNLWSEWGRDDLAAIAGLPMTGVYYPEPESAEELDVVCRALDDHNSDAEIAVLLENARSFVNLKDLASARRVTTLCHAQGDLALNLGITLTDTRETMAHTAAQTVLYARAYGLDAIDTILPSNLRDQDLTRRYVESSKRFGFNACSTFYAPHIDVINDVLSPTGAQIENARNIVLNYEKNQRDGRAAFVQDNGIWVTLHQYRQAKALLAQFSRPV